MDRYILIIVNTYPGWSLIFAFLLALATLEVVPRCLSAIRGGPFVLNKTVTKVEKKDDGEEA